ncbi:MAG: STAS domain-containing protein [Spirochaetaceae bacterium]|jgi:anti-sigma B factor antagonist|nr:STAS domain-containing protein [Spirochaetaceae bacterium]
MTIQKTFDAEIKQLTLTLKGRLDTTTAPELEKELKTTLEEVNVLVMDFADLVYLSSAGIRVIILAQKLMKAPKKMMIRNVNEIVYEVFEMTGLTEVIKINTAQ